MMIFFPLLRKFMPSIKVCVTSFFLAIAGYAILLVMFFAGVSNLYVLFVPAFLVFVAFGMLTVLTTIFLANSVDYGQYKNGRREESVIFSMQTFVVKLASGISAFIASIALAVFHISSEISETDAAGGAASSSVVGLRLTMTVVPIVGLLVAYVVFKTKYFLTDAKMEEINNSITNEQKVTEGE